MHDSPSGAVPVCGKSLQETVSKKKGGGIDEKRMEDILDCLWDCIMSGDSVLYRGTHDGSDLL